MDTIVRDPFYQDVPAFFGWESEILEFISRFINDKLRLWIRMPMKQLLECKHPMVWIEFEKGLIDEVRYHHSFFLFFFILSPLTFGFRRSLLETSL
jgi:hypothetical protein